MRYGWYIRRCDFSLRPRWLRSGPYWAIAWAGLLATNLNVTLTLRMHLALREERWK